MEWTPDLITQRINLNFKHDEILRLAMLHTSYAQQIHQPDDNNQRLAWLGEGILNFVIIDYLYHACPYLDPTRQLALQEKLTESDRLTRVWFQLDLGDYYPFLAMNEERQQLRKRPNNPFFVAFKALVGAIYCDRGFSQTRTWLHKYLIAPLLEKNIKDISERTNPDKQLTLLGDSLLKAVTSDYFYHHLPYVEPKILKPLHKKAITKEQQVRYFAELTTTEWTELPATTQQTIGKSLKRFLAALYLKRSEQNAKDSFRQLTQWFSERFMDDDAMLKAAVTALLKADKPQKWIIRYVMGYPSKDYHAGREHFHELMDESSPQLAPEIIH